jgi:hypothetical protein
MFSRILQDCRATDNSRSALPRSRTYTSGGAGFRVPRNCCRPGIHSADFPFGPGQNCTSPASLTNGEGNGADGIPLSITVYARITRLDLDRATPEEYRKLAENIFCSRGKKSPRVVPLVGIVFGKSSSRISAHSCGLADALHTKGIEILRAAQVRVWQQSRINIRHRS